MELKKSHLKQNNIITAFEDWENCKKPIGTVILLEKLKTGLPFILKDSQTIKKATKESFHSTDIFKWTDEEKSLGSCNVYNSEKWICKIIKSEDFNKYPNSSLHRLNIRYLEGNFEDSQIFSSSSNEDEYDKKIENKTLVDTFLKVNGEEIY